MLENKAPNAHGGGDGEDTIDENDRIINSVQSMREKFIADLMVNGQAPKDIEDRAFMIQLMNGATGTALGNKKIKAGEKAAASQQQIIQNLAEAVRIGRSMESAANREALGKMREVPKMDVQKVPGHTDIGAIAISTTSIANGGDGYIEKT